MDRQQQLDALSAEIVEQSICPELKAQAIQLVKGAGTPNADIVFIGEAPGKKEDEQGVPFIGAAGKILAASLETIGLTRDDVYITNIVKYRPPKNRDPKPEEKAAFWPYLERELEIIQPKLIVALGRHSMGYFLPDAVIGEVHGTPTPVYVGAHKAILLPIYHPAATIYNQKLRSDFDEDFRTIPGVASASGAA